MAGVKDPTGNRPSTFATTLGDLDAHHDPASLRQRMSALTQHLQTSVEAERAAIAREIHDDVGGSLTALKFDLAWIERRTQDAEIRQRVHHALETVTAAIEASQRIMHNLRPAILDQGLVAALQWMTARFEKRTGVATVFRTSHEALPPLPAGVALTAYRTAQEALTNIDKHAQARRVSVDLLLAHGILSLEVADDGRGFDVKADPAGHFGLLGMRERAQRVGARLELHSQRGRGTEVRVCLPLAPAAQWGPPDQAGAAHGRSA